MASVKKNDIPDIAAFMTEFWELIKSVWEIEENNAYWQDAENRASELGKKYDNDFCKGEILVFMDFLEWRRQKNSGETKDEFCRWLYNIFRNGDGR